MGVNTRSDEAPGAADLAAGFMTSRMLYVAAKLGIAEVLAEGAVTGDELARATTSHRPSLERFLRALTRVGFLREEPGGRFALTAQGRRLHRDHPQSIVRLVLECGAPHVQAAWSELSHAVRTGRSAFSFAFGADYGAYVRRHRNLGESAFHAFSAAERAEVAGLDLSEVTTLVDVGSGSELLAEILARNPQMKGLAFGAPVMGGADPLVNLPAGADAYLLAGVLRDSSDEDALGILASCRRAAGRSSRLIVVEPASVSPPAVADLHRLVLGADCDRSVEDLCALVTAAGFAPRRALTLPTGIHLVEAIAGGGER